MHNESHTPDEFLDNPDQESQPAALDNMYKKITAGQEMDVHAMLVPRGRKLELRPHKKERVVVLSIGTVVVQHGDQKNTFKAPAHFILPPSQLVNLTTLEDIVCYGIDHHEQKFVELEEIATEMEHFFTEGVYARKMLIPAGTQVPTHKHAYDHLSILAQGRVRVAVGRVAKEYVAPAMIEIKKDIAHTLSAVEDSVWFCVHATDATDIESLEPTVIVKD
jgi:quercetin dioxygenase-like cupin family protein